MGSCPGGAGTHQEPSKKGDAMFPLFPLPPTAHQAQRRRHRDEFGQDLLDARQRHRAGQATVPILRPPASGPATALRRAVGAALIWTGVRLQDVHPAGRADLGPSAIAGRGTSST